MRKTILFLIFILLATLPLVAETVKMLENKAEIHFRNREWKEALNVYDILLDEYPRNIEYITESVIVSSKLKSPQQLLQYFQNAQLNGVSVDSLFLKIDSRTRQLGESYIYESALKQLKEAQPWMKKKVNTYLLSYYQFRQIPAKVIPVADDLLTNTPDNVSWLKAKGDAYFNLGEIEKSLDCYMRILEIDENNVDACLFVGNYNYLKAARLTKRIQEDYRSVLEPNRMQYAAHKKKLNQVLDTEYAQAEFYLEKANLFNTTPSLRKTLYDIYVQRSEVDKAQKMLKKLSK